MAVKALISLLGIIGFAFMEAGVMGSSPQFPSMFVFGDSLVDNGNNNYLNSLAKANYVPYGIDFKEGPTGRFCNGENLVDVLNEFLGLPLLPSFATTSSGSTAGKDIVHGVNYASAAGGILDESGLNLGDRYSLRRQVQNFEITLTQLKTQMNGNELNQYLAKSLVMMIFGSNDYLNNYLLPSIYTTSLTYNPNDFADLLINKFTPQILALHGFGFRKFFLVGIGPIGCMPNLIATGLAPPGKCVEFVNNWVQIFNVKLRALVDQLNRNHSTGTIFVYGNSYGAFSDVIVNPSAYGFRVTDRGCCGIGRNQGQITCLPYSFPCSNRDQYMFWDAYHPTQALNRILAQRAYAGPRSDCYPINIEQMALL
ncbi:GDSL esterase/lipase [Tripterygium wilfordii]|uniref:GDSL esterase/lipase n=1 Tax=Tripterygium wilfordii TaxID=458696 RepID=A0A7J7DFG8_TRIWF|nr:GDSL esterase/lipase At5g08460-like [Tripterygium wilfordii]KAF5745072.1 GDSL esterase/lipase [Tripterygium wilfordii]